MKKMPCNKIKREIFRLLKQGCLAFDFILPSFLSDKIVSSWNKILASGMYAFTVSPLYDFSHTPLTELHYNYVLNSEEVVHPDVVVREGGIDSEIIYLMAVTPLPDNVEYYENPELFISNDGINWSVPDGAYSPIVSPPSNWAGYNSDPDLLDLDGTLHLFYRRVKEIARGHVLSICHLSTDDLRNWTTPEIIFEYVSKEKYPAQLMSPTVQYIDGLYCMWYVSEIGGSFHIYRTNSKDLKSWSAPVAVMIDGDNNVFPWHIDIIRDPESDTFVMALCAFDKKNKGSKFITFALSGDGGETWRLVDKKIMPGQYGFGGRSLYRASIVANSGDPEWMLYYSGQHENTRWQTVMLKIPPVRL